MSLLSTEPRSAAGLMLSSQHPWNDLADPVFYGVSLAGLMLFYLSKMFVPYLSSTVFPFSSVFLSVSIVDWGVRTDVL